MKEREGKVGVKIFLEELGFDDLFLLCLEYIHIYIYIYIYICMAVDLHCWQSNINNKKSFSLFF